MCFPTFGQLVNAKNNYPFLLNLAKDFQPKTILEIGVTYDGDFNSTPQQIVEDINIKL